MQHCFFLTTVYACRTPPPQVRQKQEKRAPEAANFDENQATTPRGLNLANNLNKKLFRLGCFLRNPIFHARKSWILAKKANVQLELACCFCRLSTLKLYREMWRTTGLVSLVWSNSLAIVRIDNENDGIGVLVVIAPQRPNLVLAANVPTPVQCTHDDKNTSVKSSLTCTVMSIKAVDARAHRCKNLLFKPPKPLNEKVKANICTTTQSV